jgi:hypothetical protein
MKEIYIIDKTFERNETLTKANTKIAFSGVATLPTATFLSLISRTAYLTVAI